MIENPGRNFNFYELNNKYLKIKDKNVGKRKNPIFIYRSKNKLEKILKMQKFGVLKKTRAIYTVMHFWTHSLSCSGTTSLRMVPPWQG